MEKWTQDLKKLAFLYEADFDGDEHICNDCGLLERLSVDRLSRDDTRRFAEHLENCEYCRQECVAMREAGFYEDMPFYDRIRAYEANPAAEKDEYWKSIAFAFKPELATRAAGETAKEEAERSPIEQISARPARVWKRLGDGTKSVLSCDRLSGASNSSKPAVLLTGDVAKGRTSILKTRAKRLIYSAALALAFVAGVYFGNPSPQPQIPNAPYGAEIPGVGSGAKGINVGVRGILAPQSNARETQGSTNVSASNANGPSASANAAATETTKCLGFDFGRLNEVYREGKAAFDAKDYPTAAAKFDELANALTAEEKVDVKALSVARWNLAVATIQGGDVQKGVGLLKALLNMKLDDEEMNARINAAIKTFEK